MRLRLTKRTDYAIRACLVLAEGSVTPLSRRRIAERMSIPDGFLAQILADLSRAGMVRSVKGKLGGYLLSRDAATLTLLAIIEAVEGPSRSDQCVLENRSCSEPGPCLMHAAWSTAQSAFIEVLATTTIVDVAGPGRPAHGSRFEPSHHLLESIARTAHASGRVEAQRGARPPERILA